MTLNELIGKVLELFPDAIVDEQDGEIVIATGMTETEDGTIVPLEV